MKHHDIFISYSSLDRERVVQIADYIEQYGVSIWRDGAMILGGENWGSKIVHGIRNSKLFMLMCSNASMRSRNVKQEIQLAWRYHIPYLPLHLEPVSYSEQVEFFLEGWQWIEVLDRPVIKWFPELARALKCAGIVSERLERLTSTLERHVVTPRQMEPGLDGLKHLARFTDQIWLVLAEAASQGRSSVRRGLGAPQPAARYGFQLGSRVRLLIQTERKGHLLLLDEATEGQTYCLCPSWFAPDTRLEAGITVLPQLTSPYDAFMVIQQFPLS